MSADDVGTTSIFSATDPCDHILVVMLCEMGGQRVLCFGTGPTDKRATEENIVCLMGEQIAQLRLALAGL